MRRNNDTKYTPSTGTVKCAQGGVPASEGGLRRVSTSPPRSPSPTAPRPALYAALRALVNSRRRGSILSAPYWVSYIELIQMVGGVPVVVEASEAEALQDHPREARCRYYPQDQVHDFEQPLQPHRYDVQPPELETQRSTV